MFIHGESPLAYPVVCVFVDTILGLEVGVLASAGMNAFFQDV